MWSESWISELHFGSVQVSVSSSDIRLGEPEELFESKDSRMYNKFFLSFSLRQEVSFWEMQIAHVRLVTVV